MAPPHVPTGVASTNPRARMIAAQLIPRGIHDQRVLEAMLEVPRERFIPPAERAAAYEDSPQPVACGQTISQPYIVARMLELLEIDPTDRVLEVGTGTGYQAALLGRLASSVVTIERHPALATEAAQILAELGVANVEVRVGDGTLGSADRAPFDAIIVAAAGPRLPPALLAQLGVGGRMICPVGSRTGQRLVRVVRARAAGGPNRVEELDPVVFVPLIGAEGWERADVGE
jgi:protein-L-isoaspartate(D-aspartate) O-methyltransferase